MRGLVQHLETFVPLGHDPSREQCGSVAQWQEPAGEPCSPRPHHEASWLPGLAQARKGGSGQAAEGTKWSGP